MIGSLFSSSGTRNIASAARTITTAAKAIVQIDKAAINVTALFGECLTAACLSGSVAASHSALGYRCEQ